MTDDESSATPAIPAAGQVDTDAALQLAQWLLEAAEEDRPAAITALRNAHPALVRTQLHAAAAVGDTDAVASLLAAGVDPNLGIPVDQPGLLAVSPLYVACLTNQAAVAAQLLAAGANPDDGESVYHAAERDHRACLEQLVAAGASISARHPHWDNTPLYFLAGFPATHPRAASVARGMTWLLEHGADPTVPSGLTPSRTGSTGVGELPLHRVASRGDAPAVATLLLTHGTPVDAPRADGRTALSLAVRGAHTAMVAVLRAHGANPQRVSSLDQLCGACLAGDTDAVEQWLAADPTLAATLREPMPDDLHHVLLHAGAAGQADAVERLVALGWSLHREGPWGGTALHWAAWHGQPAVVERLLALGAPVNVRDSQYGSSPIAWAGHGSTNGRHGHEAEYVATVQQLAVAGATRAPSVNRWHEVPESMASPAVADALRAWAAHATAG